MVPGEVDKLPLEPGVTLPVAEAIQKVKSSQQLEPSEIQVLGEELGEGEALAQSQEGRE